MRQTAESTTSHVTHQHSTGYVDADDVEEEISGDTINFEPFSDALASMSRALMGTHLKDVSATTLLNIAAHAAP